MCSHSCPQEDRALRGRMKLPTPGLSGENRSSQARPAPKGRSEQAGSSDSCHRCPGTHLQGVTQPQEISPDRHTTGHLQYNVYNFFIHRSGL